MRTLIAVLLVVLWPWFATWLYYAVPEHYRFAAIVTSFWILPAAVCLLAPRHRPNPPYHHQPNPPPRKP